ncbi:MAG TPA: GNAT family N-acetyltransferase [Acidimicrobiia bacterium]|jgi:ribosomal protein S18 acetylase RimI-like enzyme|nr:GNAT family N-acetyltransferase [Acidimicrobiia bacterium]
MVEPEIVPSGAAVVVELHDGDRDELRALFELAEDSPRALDHYLHQGVVLVARQRDDVVGHLQLTIDEDTRAAEITNMAVVETHRRSGIGAQLVAAALDLARRRDATRVRVATATADTGNLRFYQRQGFRFTAVERDAFTTAAGYPPDIVVDGVELRDRVWLDRMVGPPPAQDTVTPARSMDSAAPSDRQLVADAARRLGVPRASVVAHQTSFVLHAPLELLARATLLPAVAVGARDQARRRITTMVDRYEEAGSPFEVECATTGLAVARNTRTLFDALDRRDAGAADCAAHHLDEHASAATIAQSLASTTLPLLAAAGHANIYVGLLARPTVVRPAATMLRSVIRSLVTDEATPMPVPAMSTAPDLDATMALFDVLADLTPVGPPPSPFIAPLVGHAFQQGLVEALTPGGTFRAPADAPRELLRFAAQAMLQGDPDQAPFGWTHCLTLAQGALRAGSLAGDAALGTYVAMVYLVAHWGAYGIGQLDPDHVPPPSTGSLHDALPRSPREAAAVAWHDPDRTATVTILASAASTNHDAHRVKYTLACLDAAADDPSAEPLYLAAAAYLNSWWELRGDPDDPWR